MGYKLNTEAAKRAGAGGRITETGEYIGKIESVEEIEAKTGTKGVNIIFVDDTGARADRLTLYTVKADGTPIMGYDTLMALMTVCKLKNIDTAKGTVKAWDSDASKTIDKPATVFPDFAGKRVGLLLQKEEYQKDNGDVGASMRLSMPFCAESSMTANEILGKATEAVAKDKFKAALRDKLLPVSNVQQRAPVASQYAGEAAPTGFEDDDVPW